MSIVNIINIVKQIKEKEKKKNWYKQYIRNNIIIIVKYNFKILMQVFRKVYME